MSFTSILPRLSQWYFTHYKGISTTSRDIYSWYHQRDSTKQDAPTDDENMIYRRGRRMLLVERGGCRS
uniref:Uncharacterized protein n=1 Tax=Caenorhabditis japonica TaxID=281687 RepID=A0A8R1EGA3_CAEJA